MKKKRGDFMSLLFYNITGMDIFYFINCFFIYSFMGWIFECIVMSVTETKPVNRGFVRGPLCTVYGVGALGAYFLFKPFAGNKILLFIIGAAAATVLEIAVALLMTKIFGYFWWNYNNKKFNFKGVICLESTICWGVMAIMTFIVFQPFVEYIANIYYGFCGKALAVILIIYYCIDFYLSFHKAYEEKEERLANNCEDFAQLTFDDILHSGNE